MRRPIKIQHPLPTIRNSGFDIFPIGLYCNVELQKAKSGDMISVQTSWKKENREIVQTCRFRINSPEFYFMLRHIYGMNMTIAKLIERWEAWATVEGIGNKGFSQTEAIIIETKPIKC